MFSLKEKEVNTGRQRELDLVKGFLLIMIVFIHSFRQVPACICLPWDSEVISHAIPRPKIWLKTA